MILLILIVLGLCLGSFINAFVWRFHEQDSRSKKKKKPAEDLSIIKGHSMCPNCKHQLSAIDLVPVLSWLFLMGKCRYCHQPISAQYPLVELVTALAFVMSYTYWPLAFTSKGTVLFAFWLVFLVGLIALALYDLKWYLLPDKITYALIVIGLVQASYLLLYGPLGSVFWQLLGSFLIGGGLFYVIFQISNGRWIGGGDVKLGALLGLILANSQLMILTIFLASILGTLVALPLMAAGKATKTTRIPFGPFLIAAAFIAQLFGLSLINWYKHKFLYY